MKKGITKFYPHVSLHLLFSLQRERRVRQQ